MDSETIDRILSSTKNGKSVFQGCYPSDQLPLITKYPSGMIINEDPASKEGSHWVAFFAKSPSSAYYFDSLGRTPTPTIHKYLNNYKIVRTNIKSFQFPFNKTCGHYCIYFILYASLGTPFNIIIKTLSRQRDPDHFVKTFVKIIS
jgi:hypothetical protein